MTMDRRWMYVLRVMIYKKIELKSQEVNGCMTTNVAFETKLNYFNFKIY